MLVAAMVLTVSLPAVPRSCRVSKVFGVLSASLIVSVPLVPAVLNVMFGAALERLSADAPVKLKPPKVGEEVVAMSCGNVNVTLPVEPETATWLVVPVSERTPAFVKVTVPPKATVPPPERPVPAVTVTEELTNEEFGILLKVLSEASIVLLVKVWAWLRKAKVSLALSAGIVATTEALGATLLIVVVLVVPSVSWLVVLVKVSAAKVGVALVLIDCGSDSVTAPVCAAVPPLTKT